MAAEANLRKQVTRWLKGQTDVWFVSVAGGPAIAKGTPDILACVCGMFLAIELKAPKGKGPTVLQLRAQGGIRAAGGISIVARTLYEVQMAVGDLRSCAPEPA